MSSNAGSICASEDGNVVTKKNEISLSRSENEQMNKQDNTNPGKNNEEETATVPYKKLYLYADRFDYFLIITGTIAAVVHGGAFPIVFVIFGVIANSFTEFGRYLQCDLNYTTCFNTNYTNVNQSEWESTIQPSIDFFEENNALFSSYFAYAAVVILVLGTIHTTSWSYVAARQEQRIRNVYFKSILRQDITYHEEVSAGELTSRLSHDIKVIEEGLGSKVSITIQYICATVSGLILGFLSSWKLTLVTITVAPVMAISSIVVLKISGPNTKKELEADAKGNSIADEAISSIRTVFGLGCQSKIVDRYVNQITKAKPLAVKAGFFNGLSYGLFDLTLFGVIGLALWYGVTLIVTREITVEEFFSFFSVLIALFNLGSALGNFETFSRAKAAGANVFEVIDRAPVIDIYSDDGDDPSEKSGEIRFDAVHFAYPTRSDAKVLNGLTLNIKEGCTTALVGTSGCGKSTVIQLIQRFYDCQEGSILVGGKNVKDLNVRKHRQLIGVVSQEPILFATTIAENIRWGREEATDAEVEDAAKKANAYDFINGLPQKFETLVGEGGGQMSGGQKQRIAIARAIVRNPKILLLDEATSALDTESESIVQAALEKASAGRTTLVVAHRLSTICNADKIIVLDDGVVIEEGTHHSLLQHTDGVYAKLVSAQSDKPRHSSSISTFEDDVITPLVSPTRKRKGKNLKKRSRKFISENRKTKPIQNSRTTKRIVSDDDAFVMSSTNYKDFKSQRFTARKSNRFHNYVSGTTSIHEVFVTSTDQEEEATLGRVSFWDIIRQNKNEWASIVLACLAATGGGSAVPFFSILFADMISILGGNNLTEQTSSAIFYGVLIFVIGLGLLVFYVIEFTFFAKSGAGLVISLRKKTLCAILRQDVSFFDDTKHSTGVLCSRLTGDVSRAQGASGARIGILLKIGTTIGMSVAIAFVYSWKLSLLILSFIPFQIVGSYIEGKVIGWSDAQLIRDEDEAEGIAGQAIKHIRTLTSLTMDRIAHALYIEVNNQSASKMLRKSLAVGLSFGFGSCVIYFAYAAVFRLGAQQILEGEITFDNVYKVLIALLFGALISGLNITIAPSYSQAKLAAMKVFALLRKQPETDGDEGLSPAHCKGEIVFKSVNFSYPSQPGLPVLRRLNISVRPGETLALVGHSGCGKSTVVQLLERFYHPLAGTITLDGVDIRQLNVAWLRQQMGLVSQEPVLFDLSIDENIRYGDCDRTVSSEEVEEAARRANIDAVIQSFPDKYSTRVGASGSQLSGGQKQRVAIARALLRNPKILLLDEATSALDAESEKIVQRTLDEAKKGRTTIVIAHRLSTIKNADKIVVIEGGIAAETGTHQELLERRGIYYRLWKSQDRSVKSQDS